ncbi:TPA: kfiB protein, partial [Escherichia coli]|nr:kfiB protein [Escherichia coli]
MNKLVLIGHPGSKYQIVEHFLKEIGMNSPNYSTSNKISPEYITASLCQFYQTPEVNDVVDEREFSAVQVSTMWDSMVLELMMNNLNNKLWGWADPSIIFFLDFWKNIDKSIKFIMIYDHPKYNLMRSVNNAPLSLNINNSVDNWIAYNKRLLDFFLENKERCVLINFEAFQGNKKNIIKPLSNIIKIDNLMSAHYKNSILFDVVENNDYTKSNEIALLEKYTDLFSLSANETEITFNDTKVSEYLVSELIKERTEVLKLYNELQAYANLPYIETSKDNVSAEAALWEVVEERNSIFNIVSHLVQESKKKDADIELTKSIFKKRQFLLLNRINELKKEKEEVIKLSKINHNDVVRQEKYPDDIEKKINDIQK